MLLVDSNIFLELFLGRKRADECEGLLNRIAEGEVEAVVTRFTIHSIEAILNKPELVLNFLRNVMNSIGLQVYDASLDDEVAAAMLMADMKLDFDDAIQFYVAKKVGVGAIVSFDKHFDKVDISRKEPKDILKAA